MTKTMYTVTPWEPKDGLMEAETDRGAPHYFNSVEDAHTWATKSFCIGVDYCVSEVTYTTMVVSSGIVA